MAIYREHLEAHPPTTPNAGVLGRHVAHDPRSRAYEFPVDRVSVVRTVRHRRLAPVFDQGAIGSCTGNAMLGAVGSDPLFGTVPDDHPRKPTGDAEHDERLAVQLYGEATRLDGIRGVYPPTDVGSSGLAVAKAAKKAGLISGYQHTFSLTAALKALTLQPVIMGVSWMDSFDAPDSRGLIAISADATARGGHEIVADEVNVEKRLVGFTNSWGRSYGVAGRMFMSWDTVGALLDMRGDVTVPVPLDQRSPSAPKAANAGCLPFSALLSRLARKDSPR